MANADILLQSLIITVVAGIFAQVLAEKIQMPSIVVLIIFGIVAGPEFLNFIEPHALGDGLEVLVSLAVALILFEGGLNLDLKSFKTVNKSIRNLVTFGILLSTVGVAIVTRILIPELSWSLCVLFGALMSITGPTVIAPILQRVKVKKEIATILTSEGILADALGALVSVAVLEFILTAKGSVLGTISNFSTKLLIGGIFGYISGWILGKFLVRRYLSDELKDLTILAWVFTTFFIANLLSEHSGILAVVFTAFAVQKENIPQLKTFKKFGGQLSILFISILFILLSANLKLDNVLELGLPALFVVGSIIFLVRPISIFLCNHGLLTFKEKIFISWIGPKGIVSASVASLFSISLMKHGIEGAQTIESLVFLTIILTIILQGLSAGFVAKLCDVLRKTGSIVIVGSNALGRTLGKAFSELGREVILIDNNIDNCKDAAMDELDTIFGNCLDASVLESAQIYSADTLIATTANSEVNFLVCKIAKEEYHVENVYAAIDSPEKGVHQNLIDEMGGNLGYGKIVSIEDWKLAVSKNQVKIIEWEMLDEKGGLLSDLEAIGIKDENWLALILKRGDEFFFAHSGLKWQKNDILICLSKEDQNKIPAN